MQAFLALALMINSTPLFGDYMPANRAPTVDVSAVRYLVCEGDDGYAWSGSGFLIGDKIMVTALHVMKDATCTDIETGGKLVMYKSDSKHDLAVVTGPTLPTNVPYFRVSCEKFKTGAPYLSYGVTDYEQARPIVRMNVIYATGDYTDEDVKVNGIPSPGMRILSSAIAPGMSGGPVVDLQGDAHAVNNAGNDGYTLLYEFADTILCK